MLPIVAALGLYLTVRSGVVQIRLLPEMFRTLSDKTPRDADGKPQSVSSFQAFTMSAASRVGTGNIAGVATAIAIGGPGAVFWMWLMAAIGAASAFAESSLAQLFKVRDSQGFRGGPAYYMAKGLGARWMGVVFAVILIFCFPFAFSALQANTIAITSASAIETMTGVGGEWLPLIIGLVTAALTALVVFGGVRRIAEVTQVLVPVMALAYLLLGLAVAVVNIEQLPGAFASIFTQAFGFNQVPRLHARPASRREGDHLLGGFAVGDRSVGRRHAPPSVGEASRPPAHARFVIRTGPGSVVVRLTACAGSGPVMSGGYRRKCAGES
ncbi:alanine:cation symporter family protein [Microbacterium paludicola]|uniref:alanine:cation symporter family protein n=1 Tax=Microbacterium paludicola TaxID=300019 RepID=UPI0031CF2953